MRAHNIVNDWTSRNLSSIILRTSPKAVIFVSLAQPRLFHELT
ncbi:MAG: hypothetical protein RMK99_14710 [Anaerolineales bacterium]|nr:hypothetical protein [Anaerolineales bacterium]